METRKKISLLLIGLLGIVILFFIVVYVPAPAFINSEFVKKKVNEYFFQKTGGSIAFQESDIHLFPLPHIGFRQVRISVPNKAGGLIQSLDVYPSVWLLLRGNVQFSKLIFASPLFAVALSEDMAKASLEEIEDKIRAFVQDLTSVQVKTGDLVLTADLGRSALKSKTRATSRVVEDLDIPPPDPSAHSQTDGFREGLLGCESKGEGGGRVGSLETEFSFLVREDPLHETIAPLLEYCFQTLDIHKINADTKDHRRSA